MMTMTHKEAEVEAQKEDEVTEVVRKKVARGYCSGDQSRCRQL